MEPRSLTLDQRMHILRTLASRDISDPASQNIPEDKLPVAYLAGLNENSERQDSVPAQCLKVTSRDSASQFIGYVETTVNALRLIHAARQGVIPCITRPLNDSERRTMIKSGAVFVFCVEESQIKRWTGDYLSLTLRVCV